MNIDFVYPFLILAFNLNYAKAKDISKDSTKTTEPEIYEINDDTIRLKNVNLDLGNQQDEILIDGSMKKKITEEHTRSSIEGLIPTEDMETFHG